MSVNYAAASMCTSCSRVVQRPGTDHRLAVLAEGHVRTPVARSDPVIRVYRDHMGDWTADCPQHDTRTYCTDWELALEAAYGHAAMSHPRPTYLPAFEVRISDGQHVFECWGIAEREENR